MSETMEQAALQRLLDYVQEERDRRCQDLIDEAEAEANAIVKSARSRATELVHHAVVTEKSRRDRENQRIQAEVRMRLRRTWFRLMRRELARAWPFVQGASVRYWDESKSNRLSWLSSTLKVAEHALGPGLWHVKHPENWHMLEGAPIFRALKDKHEGLQIHCEPANHVAGFLIRCGDASVSTTLDGLFSKPSRIEGILLAMLLEANVLILPPVL